MIYDEQVKERTSLGMNYFLYKHGQVTKVECIIAPTECHTMGECNTILSAYTLYRYLG